MDTQIEVGAVLIELDGDDVVLRSAKAHDLFVRLPKRILEAWCLRKLREELLQPASSDDR
jgi:hypothetical protein